MGSKKKRAKHTKPRLRTVTFDLGVDQRLTAIRVDTSGRLTLMSEDGPIEPVASTTELSYDRAKGPKIVARTESGPGTPPLHPDNAIETADRVFVIDTSSRDVGDDRLHTSAVLIAQPVEKRGDQVFFGWQRHIGFEFRGRIDRPEAFAWSELIERLRISVREKGLKRVCIVVDAHLGDLASINARTKPLWATYMLPDGFELVYASADASGTLLSAWMRVCDKESAKLSRKVEASPSSPASFVASVVGGPQLRIWNPIDGNRRASA
ncbi:MAG TPA: hypothetical protein PLY94_07220 [Gemmatimonadaceae bacterium]|nr:hypothetical protein [Gemmatimonadaceae bacterium]